MSESKVKFCVRIRNAYDDLTYKRTNYFIHKNLNNKLISLEKPILRETLKNNSNNNYIDNLNDYNPSIIHVDNVFDENE